MINRRNAAIALILAGYLALQLVFLLGHHAAPVSDMLDYNKRALALLQHHTFHVPGWSGSTYRGPGYTIFLAGIYYIFGYSWTAVYVVQSFLMTATLLGVYLLAKRLFSARVATISLALCLLYLPLFAYSHVLMTESLFIFLLIYACCAFVRAMQTSSKAWLCVTGILCGLASSTRSQAMFLPLVFILAILLGGKPLPTLKKMWVGLVLMIVAMALVLAPWTIRNYLEQERFIPGDTVGGLNLLVGNNSVTNGYGFSDVPLWSNAAVMAAVKNGETAGALDAVMRQQAVSWISAHPLAFVQRTVKRMELFFGSSSDWLVTDMGSATLNAIWITQQPYVSLVLLFAAVGGVAGLFRGRKTLLPLLAFLYIMIVVSLFYFQVRYRLPAMPFALILAAYGINSTFELARNRWILSRGGVPGNAS